MSVIFGSARINEFGSTVGGASGDQGSEVSTQTYYTHSKGWYGFAPKSDSVAQKLAQAMQDACDNQHIGYCQDHRGSLLTQYKNYGSIKAIATNCECDCSSLVRVCIYQATGTLLSDFTTGDEPSVLAASGFFATKKTVSSASACCLGMVLCTQSKGHTGIICSGAPLPSGSSSSGSTTSSTGTSSDSDYTYTSKLDVDGEIGPNTVKRLQTFVGQKGKNNVDGFIDGQPSSLKKYWTAITSKACKWTGGTSACIKKWQSYLINKGYSCGSDGADGKLGKNTALATQKFLIAKKYSCGSDGADGKIGANSAKALQNFLNDNR